MEFLRQLLTGPYPEPDADPEIVKLFETALADMKKQGADIVEGIKVAEIDNIPAAALGDCNRFKHDLKAYLAHLGPDAPMKSLDDILALQKFHPSVEKALLASQAASDLPPEQNPKCQEVAETERRRARGVLKSMDDAKLDALVYPSWNFPPRLIGDLNTPPGNNSPRVAPPTGFPALTVPMGFARGTLPAGLQILGRPWSEPTLFRSPTATNRRPGTVVRRQAHRRCRELRRWMWLDRGVWIAAVVSPGLAWVLPGLALLSCGSWWTSLPSPG